MINEVYILIGYMGVGKTTFGKRLAKELGYAFVDADMEIEKWQGKSIPEIFFEKGEKGFRDIETTFLNNFKEKKVVLSTGGGMPCFNNNINVLNALGLTIYLQRPAKELMNRLVNAKSVRPIIADKTEDELLPFIEKQLNDRELFYCKAKLTLNRNKQNVEDAVKEIKRFEDKLN